MESIITTSLKDITLSSQFLALNTPKGEIVINIKQLLKESIGSDSAYFNVTQIAKLYNVRTVDYFRSARYEEYEKAMMRALSKKVKGEKFPPLKKTIRGKYNSGTFLHSKMVIDFLRWVDVDFAVELDLFIQDLIVHSNELKIERNKTKVLFKPLTDSIKDIYIPAQESDNGKKFAYSTLCNMVNIKALGTTSKKFIEDYNLDKDVPLRDQLDKSYLDKIKILEEDLNGYIKYGGITDYDTLKEKIKG